jgi:hypothetical protein
MVPGRVEGAVLDSLINRIVDTLLTPFKIILNFLTDPKNLLAVG